MKTPEEFLEENGITNITHLSRKNVILLIKLRDLDHDIENFKNIKNDLSI